MSKSEINYDFNNAKSLKIYPRKSREPISSIPLSSPTKIVRTALNASEKELKHVMSVANRRLDRVYKLVKEKESSIEDAVRDKDIAIKNIITENIKSGSHLVDEVFIPEYLGFLEIPPEGVDETRIYVKDGFSITRFDDRWLVSSPDISRTLVLLKNMHNAIIILESLGLDVNFTDYLECKYNPERKTLEQSAVDVIDEIISKRK